MANVCLPSEQINQQSQSQTRVNTTGSFSKQQTTSKGQNFYLQAGFTDDQHELLPISWSDPAKKIQPTGRGKQTPHGVQTGRPNQEFIKDTTLESVSIIEEEVSSLRKKKTPMCLINELARYHKFQPQYHLTAESGPAHQRIFLVTLKLGEEEYSASGQSIKKAQHAAAQLALQDTKFQFPEPKPKTKKSSCLKSDKSVTPTVELNALAMKLNLSPVYVNHPPVSTVCSIPSIQENLSHHTTNSSYNISTAHSPSDFRLMDQITREGPFLNADFQPPFVRSHPRPPLGTQRFYYTRATSTPMTHRVTLTVGQCSVTGEGPSPQAARHSAARQALEQLQQELAEKNDAHSQLVHDVPLITEADADADLKSPVSVAHELALKLNQTIEFHVLSESGPPHMRKFVVQCKLGDFSVQGEGNCKKLAKRKAAELMLEELKKSYPNGLVRVMDANNVNGNQSQHNQRSNKGRPVPTKRKPKNLVKESITSAETAICNGSGMNSSRAQDPISQLVQFQQGRKEKEPTFTVISERGIPRQPEFVVQVVVGSLVATGVGSKKKDAKRAAAIKALEMLGVSAETQGLASESAPEDALVITCKEQNCESGEVGLLVPAKPTKPSSPTVHGAPAGSEATEPLMSQQKQKPSNRGLRPEIRLRYLAQVLEYEVEFSDFPKGKKGEFVTLVTLNTAPPQVCHGLGSTLEEAHDNAASNMLRLIADGGADGGLDVCGSQNKQNADDGAV